MQIEVEHAANTEAYKCSLVLVDGEKSVYFLNQTLAGTLRHGLDEVSCNFKANSVLAINGKTLVGLRVAVFNDKLARYVLQGHAFQAFEVLRYRQSLAYVKAKLNLRDSSRSGRFVC